jgi:hypothetical protein
MGRAEQVGSSGAFCQQDWDVSVARNTREIHHHLCNAEAMKRSAGMRHRFEDNGPAGLSL